MKEHIQKIMNAFGEFCLVSVLTLIVPVSLFLDIKRDGTIKEISFTEILSAGFLLYCSVLFFIVAIRSKAWRSFSVFISGLFLCLCIRELDAFFDMIRHGFWVYPVMFVLAGMCVYFQSRWKSLLEQIANFINTKPYYFIFIGLVVVLIFSRVFGCGALWKTILDQHYQKVLKTMVEEGLEFFGYCFIFYGTTLFFKQYIKRS